MKKTKYFYFAVFLLLLFQMKAACDDTATVAVLYFENNSLMDAEKYDGLRKGLCDIMITELSKISAMHVVEREKLEKIMAEIALGQSGMVDESSAPKVGKLLGAGVVTLGSYIKDMGNNIRIDIRMVEVETGKIIKAEEVSGNVKNIFKLVKKLTFKIAEQLNVAIGKEEKKLIEKTDIAGFDALMLYAEGLELLDRGDRENAREKFTRALASDPQFNRAKRQLKKLKEEVK